MATLLGISDYWWGWGDLLFRWLHVIAAIAWIGSSFYFIALDHHLAPPADERDAGRGVAGEAWEIHGGGFYRVEKFRVAPATLPEPLYWFKWEAYTTWLSGFALFVVVFFIHPQTFLVDRSVAHLSSWEAIVIAVGGLVIAWIYYDLACLLGGTNASIATGLPSLSRTAHRSFRRARRVFSRHDARHDHGRECLLRDHPCALARACEGGGTRVRPRWNAWRSVRCTTTTTLPVVFAMLRTTPVHLRHMHGSFSSADGDRRAHAPLLQPAPQGRNAWWILAIAAAGMSLAIRLRPLSAALP